MKSKEFYGLVDKSLTPVCTGLGFSRGDGAASLWSLTNESGTLVYEVSKGAKNPYLPYLGGRFKVDLDLLKTPGVEGRDVDSSISYLQYLPDADLRVVERIRDRVLGKVISQTEFEDELSKIEWEIEASVLEFEIGNEVRRNQVLALPYLDREDVEEWSTFLAERFETTVRGAMESPVFLFGAEES